MQLLLALLTQVFAQGILYVLFGEEDVNTLEVGIIRSHAIVLQILDGMHTLLRHILLGQRDGHLLSTVVTEVDEDHNITLFNRTVY